MHIILTYIFLFLSTVTLGTVVSQATPKIAIIGGGIGGTSCAYFINELFEQKISISLFEKDAIGGRLSVMKVDGQEYEAGGSIIHPRNNYMVQFSKLLDLGLHQPPAGRLGIYNGENFVFEESDWFFITMANFVWHYGLSMFHLFKDIKSMLNDFSRIYTIQEKGYAYTAVDHLLDSMNPTFKNLCKKNIGEILKKKGYSEKFLNELVQSIMMVNYGQTNNISGFAGYVSLAGAESNLWSVEGGNKLIPEGLLKNSEADLIYGNVLEVQLLPNKSFSVKYQEPSSIQVKQQIFDVVIVSSPLIKGQNNIKFLNFSKDFQQFERTYHQTVTTFIKGILNPLVFNQKSVPEEILTNNNSLQFNSISRVSSVNGIKIKKSKDIYKMFSQKPLSLDSVEKFFQNINLVKEKVWLAYPHYNPPDKFVPFILYPGLYYTNAIELSASAMEMSAIAAKNVALLIFNFWKNSIDKIDPIKITLKDEL